MNRLRWTILLGLVGWGVLGTPLLFGATPGTLKWTCSYSGTNRTSPAVARDGTIYIGGNAQFKAINPSDGSVRWTYTVAGAEFHAPPVILPDNGLLAGASNGHLYCLNSNGTLRWDKTMGGSAINHPAAVSGEGIIYLAYGSTLYAISAENGATFWTAAASSSIHATVVIGMDGAIYVPSAATARKLYAFYPDGSLKWEVTVPQADSYGSGAMLGTPAVGADGTLYLGDSCGNFRAVNPDNGSVLWLLYFIDRSPNMNQPVVHNNGYVYVGCTNSALYGINLSNPGGSKLTLFTSGATPSTPCIGADGTLYFGVTWQTTYHTYNVYAVNPDLSVKWTYLVGKEMYSSPALGPDGAVYVAGSGGNLYALNAENSEYRKGAGWPKFQHDGSNTGNALNNTSVRCEPPSYNFGNISLGGQARKSFTLTNISQANQAIGQLSVLEGVNSETEFVISEDLVSGQTLVPNQSLTFTVTFQPMLVGRRSSVVRIPVGEMNMAALLGGNGGGDGQSALVVKVLDGSNGQFLAGVEVVMGDTMVTDGNGECIFTALDPGEHQINLSREGYLPTSRNLSIPAASNFFQEFILYPDNYSIPTVAEVASQYRAGVKFMNGVDFNVKFTATIAWSGQTPSKVRFIAPNRTQEITASDTGPVEATFNMGSDFGVGGRLGVQAVTATGGISEIKEADFLVIKKMPLLPLRPVNLGGGFRYSASAGLNWNVFSDGVDAGAIPSDIPFFGSQPFIMKLIPTISGGAGSDGSAEIGLEFEGLEQEKKIESGKFAGFSFSLTPKVDIEGEYVVEESEWDWAGYVGLSGEASFSKSWPFVVMAGPVPIPTYAKVSFSVSADLTLGVITLSPLELNGRLGIGPYVRGSLGVGADEVFAVEGWVGGGADFGLQFPEEPTLEELSVYVNAGFTVYALLFTWETEALRWDWSLIGAGAESVRRPMELGSVEPKVLSRDYLSHPDYGVFKGGDFTRATFSVAEGGAEVSYATLETAAFPYPEADLAAADSQIYAVWLTDDPGRSTLNRTKLVFSKYDGATWSAPQAVCDDATADFHPNLVMFADGWAAVTWENGDQVLPDTASFDQVKQNLEICAALYDPAAGAWLPPHRFTTNNYLDRNPKISGYNRTHLMVIWTANPNNHPTGNAANPNDMYVSFMCERTGYDTNWAPAQMFWNVPYPVMKYDVLYTPGQIGMINGIFASLDMDGDTSTNSDREIWRVHHYDNQFGFYWEPPRRHTTDSIADENPQFYLGPEGLSYVMWLKGNQLIKFRPWYMDQWGVVAVFDEYNSNRAGFRLVKSPGGRMAVGWAEASEYGSDLWSIFYDPATAVWGNPQQLTHDSAVEKFPVFAFFGDDRLVSIYDREEVSTLQTARTSAGGRAALAFTPQYGLTGLNSLVYTVRTDIALLPGSMTVDPVNPAPGQECLLTVTVVNNGNTSVSNVPVIFYQGDPAQGGTVIGQIIIPGVLRPGDSYTATLLWTVPAGVSGPVNIYALLDPAATVAGDDTSNNVLYLARLKPDLRAAWLSARILATDFLSLIGRVENSGVTAAGTFKLEVRKDRPDGELLYQETVSGLAANGIRDFNYRWDRSVSGADWLYLVVDTAGEVDELNEGNNNYILKLNTYQKGDANRDWKVNIADAIRAEAMFLGIYAPDPDLADMNGDGLVDLVDVKLLLQRCSSWLEQ